MSDFITGGTRDMVIALTTDHHMREDEPYKTTMLNSIPLLLTSMNKNPYDAHVGTGDQLHGGVSAGVGTFAQQSASFQLIRNGLAVSSGNDHYVIGNHDILNTAGTGFTKAAVKTFFGMPSDYYYVDYGNWRLVFLYSLGINDNHNPPYGLGATQWTWLNNLISTSSNMRVVLFSHVPIMSVGSSMWWVYNYHEALSTVGTWNMTIDTHLDVYPFAELIRTNSCIKACFAGHTHTLDQCQYFVIGNCKFFLGGAVSGRN